MRHPLGGGMGPVCGPESIVHVDVTERGQLLRESRVVGLLARLEANVLEHPDVAVAERLDHAVRAVTDDVRGKAHVGAEQAAQAGRDLAEPRGVIDPSLRPPEVSDHDHASVPGSERLDGRDRLADPAVIADDAVAHRHVQVLAEQDPLAVHVDVVDGRFRQRSHGSPRAGR